ncbi:MAG: cupin domain-containing protein [Chloroflexota bacterium]|nr:cupin domain-containing protein [Chloroflexota bacterium]
MTVLVGAEVTGGRLALIETVEQPGSEPPCHCHHWEDELLYVLAGELALFIEGIWFRVPEGRAIAVPRGAEHTFTVLTEAARVLTLFAPAGFEGFYHELEQTASGVAGNAYRLEQWVTTAARYGCEVTGPHPGVPSQDEEPHKPTMARPVSSCRA